MLEKFIAKSNPIKVKVIDSSILDSYAHKLPAEIIYLLRTYGISNFLDGFFWIINPEEYQDVLDEIYVPLKNPDVCFARDAFGGLYVWDDDSIIYVDIRFNYSKVIGRNPSIFFNSKMTDWTYLSNEVKEKNFEEARQKLGALADDECYGYVPLLALGGSEKVENLRKVKIKEQVSIVAQTVGKID